MIVNKMGNRVANPCDHPKVPGLCAEYCKVCRTWFYDEQMRERVIRKLYAYPVGRNAHLEDEA